MSAATTTTRGSLERLQNVRDLDRAETNASPFATLVSVNVQATYCATAVKFNQQPLPAPEEIMVPGGKILRPATANGIASSTSGMPATRMQGAGETPMYTSALCFSQKH